MSQMRQCQCVVVLVVAAVAATLTGAAPQAPDATAPTAPQATDAPTAPIPYAYEYKVEDQSKELYHGKEEKGDGAVGGRVEGKYYVWLPDKRLMTVTYYVDGESGFVPTITFEDNASPPFGNAGSGVR